MGGGGKTKFNQQLEHFNSSDSSLHNEKKQKQKTKKKTSENKIKERTFRMK